MANMSNIYEAYNKTLSVIDSCNNYDHLKYAANYVDLFLEFVKNFESKDIENFSYHHTERFMLLWEMKHSVNNELQEKDTELYEKN